VARHQGEKIGLHEPQTRRQSARTLPLAREHAREQVVVGEPAARAIIAS
jgi:hypothetical protein